MVHDNVQSAKRVSTSLAKFSKYNWVYLDQSQGGGGWEEEGDQRT